MPDLLETVSLDLSLAADLLDPPMERDTDAEHVSDLINRLAGLVGRRTYEAEPSAVAYRLMAMGRIAEAVLRPIVTHAAEERGLTFLPQQVLQVDQVIGSLDGILVSPTKREAIVEIKSRYASPSNPTNMDNETHWRWSIQTMSYCYMARVEQVWMPVLYLPRGAPDICLQLHIIRYTVEELIENWRVLRNLRRTKVGNARGP